MIKVTEASEWKDKQWIPENSGTIVNYKEKVLEVDYGKYKISITRWSKNTKMFLHQIVYYGGSWASMDYDDKDYIFIAKEVISNLYFDKHEQELIQSLISKIKG